MAALIRPTNQGTLATFTTPPYHRPTPELQPSNSYHTSIPTHPNGEDGASTSDHTPAAVLHGMSTRNRFITNLTLSSPLLPLRDMASASPLSILFIIK
jgi:hypothetical protein